MAYSDQYMIFNENTKRYYLTKDALDFLGIDYRARFDEGTSVNIEKAIQRALVINTNAVYSYLHKFVLDTDKQDFAISVLPSARAKVFDALCANMTHFYDYGDMRNSPDERERAVAIPVDVEEALDDIIPELGHSLIYAGRW